MRAFSDILKVESEVNKRLSGNSGQFAKLITKQIAEAVRITIDEMGLVTTLPKHNSDAMAERRQIEAWLLAQELYYKSLSDPDCSTALRYAVIRNRINRGVHWDKTDD